MFRQFHRFEKGWHINFHKLHAKIGTPTFIILIVRNQRFLMKVKLTFIHSFQYS